jgi:HSP20 family molecular chaperone IbpA
LYCIVQVKDVDFNADEAKASSDHDEAKASSDDEDDDARKKDEMLWYYRSSSESMASPPILVKVVGVHHDDFPNIYYTIRPCLMKEQKYIADSKTELFEERQTYSKYLYALEQTFDQFPVFEHKEPAPVAATGATSQQEEIAIAASTAQEPSNNTAAPAATSKQPQQKKEPTTRQLPVNVQEYGNHFIVQARAPGVRASDLKVTVENGLLVINAFSQSTNEMLHQTIKFPPIADVQSSTVRFINGCLEIQVPKMLMRRPGFGSPFFF